MNYSYTVESVFDLLNVEAVLDLETALQSGHGG